MYKAIFSSLYLHDIDSTRFIFCCCKTQVLIFLPNLNKCISKDWKDGWNDDKHQENHDQNVVCHTQNDIVYGNAIVPTGIKEQEKVINTKANDENSRK